MNNIKQTDQWDQKINAASADYCALENLARLLARQAALDIVTENTKLNLVKEMAQ